MVQGHRVERILPVEQFLEFIQSYSRDKITCSGHTFFRLSEQQRKVFKCSALVDMVLAKMPVQVGIQYNSCYSVFYKYQSKNYIRLIMDIQPTKIEIVTFYIITLLQLPAV